MNVVEMGGAGLVRSEAQAFKEIARFSLRLPEFSGRSGRHFNLNMKLRPRVGLS